MVKLVEIDENNWLKVSQLRVNEDQKHYVATSLGIMARAYAMRASNARAYAVSDDKDIVGVLMVRDLDEEPVCYELQQLLIDYRHQNKGYGQKALELIIEKLENENKYDCIEVCVKMEDISAIHLYKKNGFVDSGYIAPDVPDSYNLVYKFNS